MNVNFKDESEVKEYLKNIGIEYRYGCYSEKNPESCHLLADYLEVIAREPEKAANLYRSTCDDMAMVLSCDKYGRLLATGSGCEKNLTLAGDYLTRACRMGNKRSCASAAKVLTHGAGVGEQARTTATELLTIGCEADSAESCFQLSVLHLKSETGAVPARLTQALLYGKRACELDHAIACANVSRMYRRGDGVLADQKLADMFLRKAQDIVKSEKEASVNFQRGVS